MAVYNIPYNRQTDPKALFAQGAQNVIGGLLQGRQRRKLIDFAGGMDPEATAMQIVTQALSKGIDTQTAMALGSFQHKRRQRHGVAPWYLSPIWATTPQGIKAREKAFEGMTKEERIKALQTGMNAASGQYFYQEGLEGGAKQPKNPVLYDYYADLLREEGIPVKERPGRPKPPSAGGLPSAGPTVGPEIGTQEVLPPLPGHPYPHAGVYRDLGLEIPTEIPTEKLTGEEMYSVIEKAQKNGIDRLHIYREAAKLKDLDLSKEEYLTALDKLAEGATAEQLIEFLK